MARTKVRLAYISNDSSRKATFKKRKRGLLKKVGELSTLCDVKACAIIYGPEDTQPEVWPSPLGVHRVLTEFNKMPQMEQNKKMMDQESFLRHRLAKVNEQIRKQQRDNREKEMTQVMYQALGGRNLQTLNLVDLNDLGWTIEQYQKDVQQRMDRLNNVGPSHNPVPLTLVPANTGSGSGEIQQAQAAPVYGGNMDMQRTQWFMEMANPQQQMGFAGEEAMLPSGNNFNPQWSNSYFP